MSTPAELKSFIGCSGWFYWHWKGLFYPAELATHHWFQHYRATFDTVELNAPFYGWPKPGTIKTWRRQARDGFVYSIKVNQLITHEKRFSRTHKLVTNFCEPIAKELGSQLGCFLFQTPPSLKYNARLLRRILDQLDPKYRNVVEFRHRSWWKERVFSAFAERNVTFCSISAPRLPDGLIRTSDVIYVRFHGKSLWYRHDYSREELVVWADRLVKSGAHEAWIYFNNDREGFAISNAHLLREEIERSRARLVSGAKSSIETVVSD